MEKSDYICFLPALTGMLPLDGGLSINSPGLQAFGHGMEL